MPNRMKSVIDCSTGVETIVELTDEEEAALNAVAEKYAEEKAKAEAEAEAKAEAKASALAKLEALGLTEEEASALIS